MWIISSFGGELSLSADHRVVFYFRWYTSSWEVFFFPPSSSDLNYVPSHIFLWLHICCLCCHGSNVGPIRKHLYISVYFPRCCFQDSHRAFLPRIDNRGPGNKSIHGLLHPNTIFDLPVLPLHFNDFSCFQAASLWALLRTTNWIFSFRFTGGAYHLSPSTGFQTPALARHKNIHKHIHSWMQNWLWLFW